MSYINKKNEYIRVNGEKIAYRELNKGKIWKTSSNACPLSSNNG